MKLRWCWCVNGSGGATAPELPHVHDYHPAAPVGCPERRVAWRVYRVPKSSPPLWEGRDPTGKVVARLTRNYYLYVVQLTHARARTRGEWMRRAYNRRA